MKILLLTQWFDPEPTFKGLAFARELVRRGHQVQVLTGFPNYPGGKLYNGYRLKFFQREMIDDVSVIRVPLYPSHDNSALKRIANYASFAWSAAILGPFLVDRADVVYVYHPPATVALPALALNFLRGMPFVYDIQDLWPDTLAATGMLRSQMLLKLTALWCRLTYKLARHIVVLSPGFKSKLQERGVPGGKISVIYNWCDEAHIDIMERVEAEKLEPAMAGRFNVVFAGTMGKAQALDAILDAASLLRVRLPNVQFIFVGGGIEVERLKQAKAERELENVLFLPRRPVSEIGSVLSMADLLLVHLKNDPLFEVTVPSKTQAYLAAGRPVLMAVRGDAARLVEEAGAGLHCAPEDAASIARAIEHLAALPQPELAKMGNNGMQYYFRELALTVGVSRFENVFENAARVS